MPSTISALLHRLSLKLSRLRARLVRDHKASSPPPPPPTRAELLPHHQRSQSRRPSLGSEAAVSHAPFQFQAPAQAQAQDSTLETSPPTVTTTTTTTTVRLADQASAVCDGNNSNREEEKGRQEAEATKHRSEAWSWTESDEREFSVLGGAGTEGTPDTDLSASNDGNEEEEDEEGGEVSKGIRMRLGRVAKWRKVVVVIIDSDGGEEKEEEREGGEEENKNGQRGFRYNGCGYKCEYPAAKREREPEVDLDAAIRRSAEKRDRWEKDEKRRVGAMVGGSRAVFARRVRRQLRQIALGDGDEKEEEEEKEGEEEQDKMGVMCSRDAGSMKTREGGVVDGDVWWKGL
jgi:hypothetical protein